MRGSATGGRTSRPASPVPRVPEPYRRRACRPLVVLDEPMRTPRRPDFPAHRGHPNPAERRQDSVNVLADGARDASRSPPRRPRGACLGGDERRATRATEGLPRGGPGCRQDLPHARRGTAPGRSRRRCGGGVRGVPRAPAHRGDARRPGGRRAVPMRLPGWVLRGDGPPRGARAPPGGRRGRRVRAQQRPRRRAQRQALAGHRCAARRHRRRHRRQRAASGLPQGRRREDHRGTAARDGARRRRPPGPADRADRHAARGTAAAHGARQHLHTGEDRRGPRQLLPARKPHRAAAVGAAVGRRPGRRGPAHLSRRARHRRGVGDPGAGGRRADRRPGGRHAHPAGRPHRRPVRGR